MKKFLIVVALSLLPAAAAAQDCGTVPQHGQALLQQLADRFPALIRSQNDDERRAWVLKAAEQLAFSVSPEWGTKNAGGGRPQSKDAIAKVVSGVVCGWDIVNGETRQLQFGPGVPLPGQVFMPVRPTDHLGGTTTPPPPPPPTGELAKILAETIQTQTLVGLLRGEVDAARREIADIRAQVVVLGSRPIEIPPTVFPDYTGRVLGQPFTLRPVRK